MVRFRFSPLGESLEVCLRVTPAMEAGIADHVWSLSEIVGLLDAVVKELHN